MNVYSIFDKKSGTYNTPFFCLTDGVAVRSLSDLVKDVRTTVAMHPADFSLVFIGCFDEVTGQLSSHSAPRVICEAVALLPNSEQEPA